ncbi:MAG: hypothetical protein DWH86_01435 [Planctomycetota bacterium]|nr:MAG: hypothetical protein DWH86_01435 [Planctomycetota bacterium]
MQTVARAFLASATIATAIAASTANADVINASFPSPTLDRWMYPFNSTPGTRPVISTFGSTPGATDFDSRDGQMLVGFDTVSQVPSGHGSALTVTRATLLVEVSNDLIFQYDDTTDPWQCFVATTDPAWRADADAGQPVECFGVGFRNGWSLQTFQENTAFAPSGTNFMAPGVRNAFAASIDANGALIDVSQSTRQHFDPKVFGTGKIVGLAPGSLVAAGSSMRFEIDVSDPGVQAYLRTGIDSGRVMLALSSLTMVQQQAGQFPAFIAKENVYVQLGLAAPARLELDVQIGNSCALADINCDGHVNGADLGLLLGNWGNPGPSDLNNSGTTDGSDLGLLLGEWH